MEDVLKLGDLVTIDAEAMGVFWDGVFCVEEINRYFEQDMPGQSIRGCYINKFDTRIKHWYTIDVAYYYPRFIRKLEIPTEVACYEIGATR